MWEHVSSQHDLVKQIEKTKKLPKKVKCKQNIFKNNNKNKKKQKTL